MDFTVKIEGLKDLESALQEAGPKLARAALRKAVKAAAQPMIDSAKANAPVDTGALRKSIKADIKLSNKEQTATAIIGPDSKRFYGMFLEFGTKHISRRSFLRPAFDSAGKESLSKFTEVMQEALPILEEKK